MKCIKIILMLSFFFPNIYPVNRLMINKTGKSCSSIASIQCLSQLTSLNDVLQKDSKSFVAGSVAQKYWNLVQDLKANEEKDLAYPGFNNTIDGPADANDATKALLVELAKIPDVKKLFGKDGPDITSVFDQDGFKVPVDNDTQILCFNLMQRMPFALELHLDGKIFTLRGFVVQSGGAAGGHFWSYAKDSTTNIWYLYEQQLLENVPFSPNKVEKAKKIHEKTIKSIAANTMIEWLTEDKPRPYIIFYERVQSKAPNSLTALQKSLEALKTKLGELAAALGGKGTKKEDKKQPVEAFIEKFKKLQIEVEKLSGVHNWVHLVDPQKTFDSLSQSIEDIKKEFERLTEITENRAKWMNDITTLKQTLENYYGAYTALYGTPE